MIEQIITMITGQGPVERAVANLSKAAKHLEQVSRKHAAAAQAALEAHRVALDTSNRSARIAVRLNDLIQ